jgi:hypothetical protein
MVQFPSSIPTQNRPTVTIYTSKSCQICNPMVEHNLRQLHPIRNLVNPHIIDIDQSRGTLSEKVLSLPSIQIGDEYIGSHPSEELLLQTLRKHIPITNVQ